MKLLKIFLWITCPIVSLFLIRIIFLPEPIKASYGLIGSKNRYFTKRHSDEPFDTSGVVKTIVFNGFFKRDNSLTRRETKALLRIMLDSSNYEWGEIGTPEFER